MVGPIDTFAPSRVQSKLDAAANVSAVVNIAGIADGYNVIDAIHGSYLGGTPSGQLTIQFAGVELSLNIVEEGPFSIEFPRGFMTGTQNQAVGVSLSPGGAGITGKLNVHYR